MDKTALRTELKARRFSLTPEERKEKSRRIVDALIRETGGFSAILAYASKEPEVETLSYISRMIDAEKRLPFPLLKRRHIR